MRISTFFYTLRQGIINIFRNKWFSLASVATIGACLFLFGLFYSVIVNFQNIVRTARRAYASRFFLTRESAVKELRKLGR